jgi:hypothetical protein
VLNPDWLYSGCNQMIPFTIERLQAMLNFNYPLRGQMDIEMNKLEDNFQNQIKFQIQPHNPFT